MLTISDTAFTALERDFVARRVTPALAVLSEAAPEYFVPLEPVAARERVQQWLGYTDGFGIEAMENVAALFGLWNQWGGFDDPDSAWIVEILGGPLHENAKIGALREMLYGA